MCLLSSTPYILNIAIPYTHLYCCLAGTAYGNLIPDKRRSGRSGQLVRGHSPTVLFDYSHFMKSGPDVYRVQRMVDAELHCDALFVGGTYSTGRAP